jgi:hypothetical protein
MLHHFTQPSPVVVGIAAAVTSAGLLAALAPAATATGSPGLARTAQMARSMAEARRNQDRVLNPREHLGHRDLAVPSSVDPCSTQLARAWQQLGHFSDAYETYLISHSPSCR